MCGPLCALACLLTIAIASPPVAGAPAETSDAGAVESAIRGELLDAPGVEGGLIEIDVRDGVVTLSGTVNNILAHDRAARVARTVRGVRVVVNEIEVDAGGRDDERIAEAVERALLFDPATESYTVESSVTGGIVTLTGTVQSRPERNLAETVVKGVLGVRGVNNLLEVEPADVRLDSEIHEEIARRLHWDTLVDDRLVSVRVEDGNVTLAGTVGTAAERQRAITDAWVAGVESVDAEDLSVTPWADDPDTRAARYEDIPDEEVAEAVRDGLRRAPRVAASDIDVEASEGVVTLSGRVDHLEAGREAVAVARNTVGVWNVIDRIRVDGGAVDDDEIASRIRSRLGDDPYVTRRAIEVTVADGAVTLEGAVESALEHAQAETIAARTAGVTAVDNELTVRSDGG